MNIATMEAKTWDEQYQSRNKYAEYMRAVKQRHNAEYEALKNAYRELSKGKQVIDLFAVMKEAGTDHRGRPKLAIMRADQKLCWFYHQNNRPTFCYQNRQWSHRNISLSLKIQLPVDTFRQWAGPRSERASRAVVPSIPPSLMPSGDLKKYHILWEAEWEQMPIDPLLLKHLGKNLYVVLAQWDLTPLERSILATRPMVG